MKINPQVWQTFTKNPSYFHENIIVMKILLIFALRSSFRVWGTAKRVTHLFVLTLCFGDFERTEDENEQEAHVFMSLA